MDNTNGDVYECPICASIPPDKIFQCMEGHIVCETCLRKIQEEAHKAHKQCKCPSCDGRLDNNAVTRNRIWENHLDQLELKCPYAKKGCQKKLKRTEMGIHESTCFYSSDHVLGICEMLGHSNCKFKLYPGNARTVFQHIKSCFPSKLFQESRFSDVWNLKKDWGDVFAPRCAYKKFRAIARVPYTEQHVLIVIKLSNDGIISSCSVDLSLCLSAVNNPRVTFSIPDGKISWSIPVVCGLESWKFLMDENCRKPMEIGVQSILQYCDEHGRLKIDVIVEHQEPQDLCEVDNDDTVQNYRSKYSPSHFKLTDLNHLNLA